MPVLTNTRRERFAQEIASGKTITEAHIVAGYTSSDGNASKLSKHPEIATRVKEIMEMSARDVEVTLGSLIREAGEIQVAAIGIGQMAAAVSALTAKAKLAGLWIDRKETGAPGEFADIENMGVEDLRAFLASRASPLPDKETDKSLN